MSAVATRALFPAPAKRFRLTAPEPAERDIHEACAQALDRILMPPAMWFTYPAGATVLSPQQMARYSRIGLKRALPDIWVLYNGTWCVELKRPGGRLSKTRVARTSRGSPRILEGQEDGFMRLLATGAIAGIAIAHSVDELFVQLARWNIPLRTKIVA